MSSFFSQLTMVVTDSGAEAGVLCNGRGDIQPLYTPSADPRVILLIFPDAMLGSRSSDFEASVVVVLTRMC